MDAADTQKQEKRPRYITLIGVLYALVLGYAVITFVAADLIAPVALLSFGLIGLFFTALEYTVPPMLAIICGSCARWSILHSVLLGLPLVLLAAVVFPTAPSQKALGVPVPWLAARVPINGAISPTVWEEIVGRLPLYTTLFVLSVVTSLVVRSYSNRKVGP